MLGGVLPIGEDHHGAVEFHGVAALCVFVGFGDFGALKGGALQPIKRPDGRGVAKERAGAQLNPIAGSIKDKLDAACEGHAENNAEEHADADEDCAEHGACRDYDQSDDDESGAEQRNAYDQSRGALLYDELLGDVAGDFHETCLGQALAACQSGVGHRNPLYLSTKRGKLHSICSQMHRTTMDNWDEIKTAYQVARTRTVSGAAEKLGVHHATVIRHIDALEGRLGIKLFQRHARGYTPTEAGEDLLRVAQATEDQFSQLASRIKGSGAGVSGDLVVTSLVALAPRIAPLLVAFQEEYPNVVVRYLTGERLFRLEYGEAHVAIRAGRAPEQPDNVVQALTSHTMALYASPAYVAAHGLPSGPEEYHLHRFVGHEDEDMRAPFYQWLTKAVPRENVVFRSNDTLALSLGVMAGAGIGFLTLQEAESRPDMVQVAGPCPEWSAPLWLVTHMDLHRTGKVQALLQFLKTHFNESDTI